MKRSTKTIPFVESTNVAATPKMPYSAPRVEKAGQWQALTLFRTIPFGPGAFIFDSSRSDA